MRGPLARRIDPIADAERQFGIQLAEQGALLRSYAHRLTQSRGNADDLLQDTMLRCWAARQGFEPGTNLTAWARTVMRNSFLSDRRRDRFRGDLPEEAFERLLSVPASQDSAVALTDLHWALSELPPHHRAAVLLAGEGVSIAESAARLSVAEGTVKSWVFRRRERLRQLTDGRGTPLLANKGQKVAAPDKPRRRRDWSDVTIG
jgi:RNA polymerase sigma-70 factor (ECF subfamily)